MCELQRRSIGTKWFLEAWKNDKRGVVVSIANRATAVIVDVWRSPTNYTSEMVSSLGHYTEIPNSVRRNASGMLEKWEKHFEWQKLKVEWRFTKMTRQTHDILKAIEALPNDSGHISVDTMFPKDEVGHICVFRDEKGVLRYAKGTPDPRNPYYKLKRSLKVKELVLVTRPKE